MRTISKQEESKKNAGKSTEAKPTPWQESHQKYLEEKQLLDQFLNEKDSSQEPDERIEDDLEDSAEDNSSLEVVAEEKAEEKEGTQEAPQSFSDKLPKMKDYRKRKLYRRLAFLLIILFLPLAACIYYISPLGQLAKVTVVNNQQVDAKKVIQTANFKINQPLWEQYFERKTALAKVAKISPWIKDVNLKIVQLNQFQINITEYPRVAYLLKDNQYFEILENGKVLDTAIAQEQLQAGLPIIEGFTSKTLILKTLKAYNQLPQELKQSISQIKSTPRSDNEQLLTLNMNDQNQVLINVNQLAKKLPYYAKVVGNMQSPGIVDMEVGIFSYPYPKEEEKTTDSSQNQSDNQGVEDENAQENTQG